MGSGVSRDTTSCTGTNQRTNHRNRNHIDGREASHRPTKRIRTSSNEEEPPEIMRDNEEDNLEAIQNDVEEVERHLNARRGILFSHASSDRSGARALFDSIGSALGNLRERLHDLAHGSDGSTTSTTTTSSSGSDAVEAPGGRDSSLESLRALSQRLDTAELSHSTRMPLNLLQSELSRRELSVEKDTESVSSTTGDGAAAAAAAARPALESPSGSSIGTRRSQLLRRPSALLASRTRDGISDPSAMPESPMGGGMGAESPLSASIPVRNLAEASFASSRNLAASIRQSSATLPTLHEPDAVTEEGIEVTLEEEDDTEADEGENYDRGLLLPDSARKLQHLRPSMRTSMRILGGDEVVRQLADLDTDKEEINADLGVEDKSATTPPPTIPVAGMYTWGSLGFSKSASCDDNENNKSGNDGETDQLTYRLFGASESANDADAPSPRRLPPDTRLGRADIVSMSASETHCAFVTTSGRLITCGNNTEGAVDPSRRDSLYIPRPTHLEAGLAIARIKKVSCGINHTAVVTDTKSVLTWGINGNGQLGHRRAKRDNTANFVYPKAFVMGNGGRRADNVACCDGYTLVLTTRMEAFVCGGETSMSLEGGGPSDNDNSYFPMPKQNSVLCGLPLVGIASGLRHLVVWTAHGTAYAWGSNQVGQCGREYPRELKVPVPIAVPKSTLVPIPDENGISHSHASVSPLLKNWNIWSRGEPISLASDVHVVDAACGKDHTILVTDSGRLLVCGSNKDGQLGLVTNPVMPPASIISSKAQSVAHPNPERRFQCVQAGRNHTILLDDGGAVWQMGNGDPSIRQVPSLLPSEAQICSIMAGGSINFAVSKSKSDETSSAMMPSAPELDELMKAIRLEHDEKKDPNATLETKSYLSSIEDLARGTENLFRSPAVMNSLFMDPMEIDHMYQTLIHRSHTIEMKQRIVSSIERGMLMGLKSMVDSRLIYFESVRFLLLYLQCPLWRDEYESDKSEKDDEKVRFDVRGDLLFLLCETILGLPFEGYKAFLSWSATVYGKKLFVPLLVKPLVQQLNHRFVNNITHGIPMIAGVLRWLHTVNQRSDDSLARGQDFYCSGIDDMSMEALFEDLASYHMASDGQRSSNFFLAAHPFLMAPAIKQKLLQVENQMSMVQAAQSEGVSFDAQTREFKFQPYFVLAIDRKHLLPQTLQAVAKASTGELRKGLKVVFKGEDGVDAGGVTKEFFQLLCEQLFDVNTGMWTTNFGDNNQTWFNSVCTWNSEGFYLVGVLCGLAVYNSVILDVHFPHAIYRKLLGLPLGLEDLIDQDVRKGLKSLLDYDGDDVEYIFCLNFEVTWMDLGQERKKELKPGGSDIAVTSENKEEYVRLYVKWLLVDSIAPQYDEFERGFNQVMEDSSLDILLAEELELLVAGTPELDFLALEQSAEYEGGFDKDSAVVRNIWKWIQSESLPTQEKFLKFCTGSSKGKFLERKHRSIQSKFYFIFCL